MLPFVAFVNEVLKAVAMVFAEIPDNDQPHLVIDKLLQDFTSEFCFEVKECRVYILFLDHNSVEALIVNVDNQL